MRSQLRQIKEPIQKLTNEYDRLNLLLYEQQNEIILGQRIPNEVELTNIGKFISDAETQEVAQKNVAEPLQEYWYKVLKNSTLICNIRFSYCKLMFVMIMKRIGLGFELEHEENNNNFTIKLTFLPNEYFTNEVLKKKFFFEKNEDTPIKSESTHIDWKEGKNITQKKVSKKYRQIIYIFKNLKIQFEIIYQNNHVQKNKKTGASRTVEKAIDADSFFNFFKDFNLRNQKELDEEELQNQEDLMNEHFDIATVFWILLFLIPLNCIWDCNQKWQIWMMIKMIKMRIMMMTKRNKGKKQNCSKGGDNKNVEKPECKQQ